MKQVDRNEIEELKGQINQAIDRGDYGRADLLARSLCEKQGFRIECRMPDSLRLHAKRKDRRLMSLKKNIAKASIAALILGVGGGSVYAGVIHFRSAQNMEYGFEISSDVLGMIDAAEGVEATKLNEEESADLLSQMKDTDITVLSKENGSSTDAWLTKEVRRETDHIYGSDDGVQYTEVWQDIHDVTEYTYTDYRTACQDNGLEELFSAEYEQKEPAVVTVSEDPAEEGRHEGMELESQFLYGNGSFQLYEDHSDAEYEEEPVIGIITSTEPASNQREYTSANGTKFNLSDASENGQTRTSTVFYSDYRHIYTIIFTGLTEDEIHEVLDTIQ